MSTTDFFVAISGDKERAAPFGANCRFISHDEQHLIKDVIHQSAESMLLLAFVEDNAVGKALCKAMFSYFAESINPSRDVYTQFKVSFVEESANDLIQYRCERLGDIDAVVEAEDGAHECSSICATNVVPKETSFLFVEQRLTLVVCTAAEYTADRLLRITENAAVMIGCRFASVGFFIPKAAMCSPIDLADLATVGRSFKDVVLSRTIGHDERVSSRVRLQDVRAWSLMVNEKNHFSAVEPGPYFVSLNPTLVVGEKMMHYIPEDRTYIVGESTNASPLDFCVMPPMTDGDALHRSVYSPHCRLRREGYAVYLKPECGMTYLNGKLIAEEQQLQHNDRVILGKQLAFRFVMVGTEVPRTPDSRILDWELCAKEFRAECEQTIVSGVQAALERANAELAARCEELERLLENARGDSWLVLTNPPASYKGRVLWPFDLRKRHSQLTIGAQGDVALSFLTGTAVLKHAMEGLVCRTGAASVALVNGTRFSVGAHVFAVSMDEPFSPARTRKELLAVEGGASADAVREVQASLFSLQWSIGALFDFVFPVKGRKPTREEDSYYAYRAPLYDTRLLESPALHATDLVSLNAHLTAAVRLMGAGLAKEMQELGAAQSEATEPAAAATATTTTITTPSTSPRVDAAGSAMAEEFLRAVGIDSVLSAAVMRQLHTDIGAVLLRRCSTPRRSPPPKSARLSSRERATEASPPAHTPHGGSKAESALMRLRGTCFLSSPQVVRRASNTVDLLTISTNAKALWERHVEHVSTIGKAFSQKKGDDANVLAELLLLIVDVVLSTDYCLRRRLLSPSEVEALEPKLATWQRWADRCVEAMNTKVTASRTTWKHEAAVQRKPTPHVQRSLAKNRGDSPALARTSVGRSGSESGLGKTSLTRSTNNYTSAPPRLSGGGASRGAGAGTGRTPNSLSSFGTVRKSSVSSAGGTIQPGRSSQGSVRRSSVNSTTGEKNTTAAAAKRRSPSAGSRGTPASGSLSGTMSGTLSGRKKAESSLAKMRF